jgi:hypothetical protein
VEADKNEEAISGRGALSESKGGYEKKSHDKLEPEEGRITEQPARL